MTRSFFIALVTGLLVIPGGEARAEDAVAGFFYTENQFIHLFPDSGNTVGYYFSANSDLLLLGVPRFERNPEFPGNSYGVGRAVVMRRVDGQWLRVVELQGNPENDAERSYSGGFGQGVAVNETGSRMVVGAPEEDVDGNLDLGGAWVYEFGPGDAPEGALIAYYSFDDPADPLRDEAGNGRILELGESAPAYDPDAGFEGTGAFSFNGSQQLLAPLNINSDAYPKLTMGAWVKTANLDPGLRKIIGHDDGGWDRVIGLDDRFGAFRYTAFIGNGRPVVGTPGPANTEDWTFIAVAYDQPNHEMTFYVDLDASTIDDIPLAVTQPTDFNSGYETLAIGSIRPSDTREGWEGMIDRVFFFNGVLDLPTIIRIRNGEILPGSVPETGDSSAPPWTASPQIVQRIESDVDSFRQFGRITMAAGDLVGVFSDERHGAPGPGFRPEGSVNIYLERDGTWKPVQKVVATDANAVFSGAFMRNNVLVVAMAGARFNDVFGLGQVEVYEWNGAAEQFEFVVTLSPEELTPSNQQFGRDVALNGDDEKPTNILVVGAPVNEGGRVMVYEKSPDTGDWLFVQKLLPPSEDYNPEHPWNEFGNSVAVSPDGRLIAVQGTMPDGYGEIDYGRYVYLFERVEGTWQFIKRLTGSRLQNNNNFGAQMVFAGNQLVIGDPRFQVGEDNQADGAIYTFDPVYAEDVVAGEVRKYLYAGAADDSAVFPKARAAFRYLDSLYSDSASGPVMTPEAAAAAFGPAEADRVQIALTLLRNGLAENPASSLLQNLLLDVYYDWTRILAIQAGEEIADVDIVRLDAPSTPGAFIIDTEIAAYSRALEANREAYRTYLDLLTDDLGVAVSPPIGFTAFRELVPSRTLTPSQYRNGDGQLVSVTGDDEPILPAYKDLILLLDLLSDQAEHGARLAFLKASNGDPDAAKSLLGRLDRELFAHASLLQGMFSDLTEDRETYPELAIAWQNLEEAFLTLSEMSGRVAGEQNLLGFDPDFLPLLPKPQGRLETIVHTFDLLKDRLTANNETLNPVLRAKNSQATAVQAWDTYQNNQSDLQAQLTAISGANSPLRERLIEIRGDGSLPPDEDPATEIYQQIQNIERARNQIQRNRVESSNVRNKIQIEVDRRSEASGIRDAMGQIRVAYGKAQATLTEQISYLEGLQKAVGSVADAANPAEFFSSLATGLYVGGVEVAKGQLQAEKDRLAGQEEAAIIAQEDLLDDANSRANIRTWMLDLNTLAVDSIDAAISLKQEQGRLASLWREKERLERRMAAAETGLKNRYFADPIHRFRARHQVYVANQDFRKAMDEVFFLIKAYEYKWNRRFEVGSWNLDTFFKIRNASELESLVSDLIFAESNITTGIDDSFDWFSFRDDFFGYKDIPDTTYVDPVTGELVDYLQAFRNRLLQLLVDSQGRPLPENVDPLDPSNLNLSLQIPFNTVREIPGGAFFEKEGYLDKIIALHIRIPGRHTLGRSTVRGTLVYGGTAFVRNKSPGIPAPDRPDKLVDEVTAYSTRVWNAEAGPWSYEDSQNQRVTITLSEDERIPPSVLSIDTFNERSVAASNWTLQIEVRDSGVDLLRLDEINDIELYFHHAGATR